MERKSSNYIIEAVLYFHDVENDEELDERMARLDWDEFDVLCTTKIPVDK